MSDGADTTVLAALAVGFVSFVSPCVLPLVPGYLSAVSGVALADVREGEAHRLAVLGPAILFCLSFTVVFVALGMATSGVFGSFFQDHRLTLNKIAGGMIIAMGVFFVLTPFVSRLNREWRPEALMARAGTGGPLVAGMAFAFAWTPCIGPTLSAILSTAATRESVAEGGVLLGSYSAGLAIPFLLSAIAFDRASRVFRWLRDRYVVITFVAGAVLIAMGTLVMTNELFRLNIEAQKFLDSIGLNFFADI